jgi:hypothetical protein
MSNQEKEKPFTDRPGLSRREFVALSGGAAVFALTGCSGGQSSSKPSQLQTRAVEVSVDRSQIGGSGLAVQSLFDPDVLLNEAAARVKVAGDVPQLLVVTDSAGKVRVAGVTNPQQGNSVLLNATSTAVALVFVTIGILSNVPSEAAQRTQQIQGLGSFSSIVTYLTNNLFNTSLQDIRNLPALNNLIGAAIKEWQALYGGQPLIPNTKLQRAGEPRDSVARFEAAYDGTPQSGNIKLQNGAFRYVNVVRQDLDSAGNELRAPRLVTTAMEGAAGASIGTIFHSGFLKATERKDNFSPAAQQATVRYWVRGPGLGRSSLIVPPSVAATSLSDDAWISTLIYYFFFPLIDGLSTIKNIARFFVSDATINRSLAVLSSSPDATAALEAISKGDVEAAKTPIINLLTTFLPFFFAAIQSTPILTGLGGQAGRFARTITALLVLFGSINLLFAVNGLIEYPNVTAVDLPIAAI